MANSRACPSRPRYPALVDLLVIGGSGLLGRRITRQAQLAGHRVIATFHASVPPAAGADWRRLDIRSRDDVTALALQIRPDAVFSGTAPSYDETRQPDPVTPYGAAKAAAETAVKGITPAAIIARTSLIIGDGDSQHERLVHALASGTKTGALFTDEVRCPVHVTDLASALLELAASPHAGICHVAGADAISRYQLGLLIAARDGLDPAAIPAGLRPPTSLPGAADVRLDSTRTQARLTTRLRGAREFLAPTPTGPSVSHH